MKLPKQAKPVMRNVSTARIEAGVNAAGLVDALACCASMCLFNPTEQCVRDKCPQCIGLL